MRETASALVERKRRRADVLRDVFSPVDVADFAAAGEASDAAIVAVVTAC